MGREKDSASAATGHLDAGYAAERLEKQELAFRYRARALEVKGAVDRHNNRKRPLSVLDLGAAEGLTLLELRDLLGPGSYVGVEISTELIKCAPALPAEVRLVEGDVTQLPDAAREEAPFTVVTALALLEHLPDPVAAVAEAVRHLAPGGLFIATCPSPSWDKISTSLGLLRADQHLADMDRRRLVDTLSQGGLELIQYQRFMSAAVGFLPYLRVPVSPQFAARTDSLLRFLKGFDWLFVNQIVVGRKPH